MKHSTTIPAKSCRVDEVFDHPGLTSVGGANLLVDLVHEQLNLPDLVGELPFQKSIFATYTLAHEIEALMLSACLGFERLFHMRLLEHDPLLRHKLNLMKLPSPSTLYRSLERFGSEDRVEALAAINQHVLPHVLPSGHRVVLDLDTTVETIHGSQEGSCVGYNPRYPGRPSYQPLMAFEGIS